MRAVVLLAVVLCAVAGVSAADRLRVKAGTQTKADAAFHKRIQTLTRNARAGHASTARSYGAAHLALSARFEGYEHAAGSGWGKEAEVADLIQFKFLTPEGEITNCHTGEQCIVTKDGVRISYAESTALAGDYFGVKGYESAIICNDPLRGRTIAGEAPTLTNLEGKPSQFERLQHAFQDFWYNPTYGARGEGKWKNTMQGLWDSLRAMLAKEMTQVDTSRKAGNANAGSLVYNNGEAISLLTDLKHLYYSGLVNKVAVAEGDILALGVNDDHFGECADDTYKFGHTAAVNMAWKAGKKFAAGDKRAAYDQLNEAFGLSAFLSHFLSDRFSAGHLRTPRGPLRDACPSMFNNAPMAGLSANVMHDEDNANCLLATNKLGKHWWVCGDHRFFDKANAQNRRHLHEAIKADVKDISDSFTAGTKGEAKPTTAPGWEPAGLKWVPTTEGLPERLALENTCPFFKVVHSGGSRSLLGRKLTDKARGIPRPPVAVAQGYGRSIRYTLSADLFPAIVDITTVHGTGLTDAVPTDKGAKDCVYEPVGVTGAYCCQGSTRATPLPSTDPTFGDSCMENGKERLDGWTATPEDATKRYTVTNQCANWLPNWAKRTTDVVTTGVTHVGNFANRIVQGTFNLLSAFDTG